MDSKIAESIRYLQRGLDKEELSRIIADCFNHIDARELSDFLKKESIRREAEEWIKNDRLIYGRRLSKKRSSSGNPYRYRYGHCLACSPYISVPLDVISIEGLFKNVSFVENIIKKIEATTPLGQVPEQFKKKRKSRDYFFIGLAFEKYDFEKAILRKAFRSLKVSIVLHYLCDEETE